MRPVGEVEFVQGLAGASANRFQGIRHNVTWHPDPESGNLESMATRLRQGLSQYLPKLEEAVEKWISSWDDLRARLIRLTEEVARALVQSGRVTGKAAHQVAVSVVKIALAGDNRYRTGGTQALPDLDFAAGQGGTRIHAVTRAVYMPK